MAQPLDNPTPGTTLGISEASGDLLNKYLKVEFAREVVNVSYKSSFLKSIFNTHTHNHKLETHLKCKLPAYNVYTQNISSALTQHLRIKPYMKYFFSIVL